MLWNFIFNYPLLRTTKLQTCFWHKDINVMLLEYTTQKLLQKSLLIVLVWILNNYLFENLFDLSPTKIFRFAKKFNLKWCKEQWKENIVRDPSETLELKLRDLAYNSFKIVTIDLWIGNRLFMNEWIFVLMQKISGSVIVKQF